MYALELPVDMDDQVRAIDYPQYDLPKNILITGGCGFLGGNIVEALVKQDGVKTIVAFDLRTRFLSHDPRVHVVQGDLTDEASLVALLRKHNIQCVIHTASPHPNLNNKGIFLKGNVEGTRGVIAACKAARVPTLVYTSSASVVWAGSPHEGVDESVAYPKVFRDYYAETKAAAEKLVMAAGSEELITISLRPHAIFGPGDRQMVPTLVDTAKEGKNGTIVGGGNNMVDFTYIGNVVHSHMLAAQTAHKHLATAGSGKGLSANGRTYFITNGEPLPFWDFLNWIWLGLGYDSATKRVPYYLVLTIAYINQFIADLRGAAELRLSPARIQIIGTVHWYSIAAARKDLGYAPLWNLKQGLYLMLRTFQADRNKKPSKLVLDKARKGNLVRLGLVAYTTPSDADPRARKYPFLDPATDPKDLPSFGVQEISWHNQFADCWLIVDGLVYDVSSYVFVHPGRPENIMKNAGKDTSKGFHGPQHPTHAADTLSAFLIGKVEGYTAAGKAGGKK